MKKALIFLKILIMSMPALAATVYQVEGENSKLGAYSGQVQIDGTKIQKTITYRKLKYQDLNIESIWSGQVENNQAKFILKNSDRITGVDDIHLTEEQVNARMAVKMPLNLIPGAKINFVTIEGEFSETWNLVDSSLAVPFWKSEAQALNVTGESQPALIYFARWLVIDKIIQWYRDQVGQTKFSERNEFKNYQQFWIQDKTDFEYYQNNLSRLRVENKIISKVSLAEAWLRRNAYGPSLSDKEVFLSKQTAEKNLNSVGILESAQIDDTGLKVSSLPSHDSALWTGMYIWSQALKYKNTGSQVAYENMKKGLSGLCDLIEIAEGTSDFARTILVLPSAQVSDRNYVQGTGRFLNMKWDRGGNNDMMKGFLVAFTAAHSLLKPTDQILFLRIAKTSQKMLGLKHIQERGYNRGIVHGIVALYNNDIQEARNFLDEVTGFKAMMSDVLDIDSGFHLGGIADWSGVHLSMVSAISQVMVADSLQKKFTKPIDRFRFEQVKKAGEKRLLEMALTYGKSHLQYLDIFTYAFSRQVRDYSQLKQKALDSLFVLHEVPIKRNYPMAVEVDLEKWQDWSPSAWPLRPWKSVEGMTKVKDDIDIKNHYQSAFSYPLFLTNGLRTTYLWKDLPFEVNYRSVPGTLPFAADYLILYWVAKDAGLLQ